LNNTEYKTALLHYFSAFVTGHKKEKIGNVLSQRTRALTVVLEDIYKPHNASAVIRTAECLGIQDIHIVEDRNPYDDNPYVTRGSAQWITLHHYRHHNQQNIKKCFSQLKNQGYQIIATTPHDDAQPYQSMEINQKMAIVFGAEETGISDFVRANADAFVTIPMAGFTESFNISVSAAILLAHYVDKIKLKLNWELSDEEKFNLTLDWYEGIVPNAACHLRDFRKKYQLQNYGGNTKTEQND